LKEGYSSLYEFCIRYLNYSEGETHRRIQACRLTSKVEQVKPLLEEGALSLTTLSLLSPVLNNDNAAQILPQVAHLPSRQVEKVIHEHFPELKVKPEVLKVELDEELIALLEEARLVASERDSAALLKKVLRNFLRERKTRASDVKRHTRYVPEHLAREVRRRDKRQCTFVSSKGLRCSQRAHLQIDHIRPYGKGGSHHDVSNLRLLCRAHNLFLAQRDFPKSGAF
jgi:5-methylcytosine-specific restriction endonuclease McrA